MAFGGRLVTIPQPGHGLVRWTFDLTGASDAIKEEAIDDLDGEFPRFDERFAGLAYRHGWYAADPAGGKTIRQNAIAHLDLKTGRRQVYQLDGGILKYFEETGGPGYQGNCFVFDERIALDPALAPSA